MPREGDRMLASVAEVAKSLEVSEHTYSRWRNQYGGMKADNAKELKRLREENLRLKRMVAERDLAMEIVKGVARGNF